jgi:hypothetical protein
MVHSYITPAWDLASINGMSRRSPIVYHNHHYHQGLQSQFLEWRSLKSLFGEQGLCKHCPKGTPLVTSWLLFPTQSLCAIWAARSYWFSLRGNGYCGHDSLWLRSWKICTLLVRQIYRPILGCLSYPRCSLRSHHIRWLQSHQTNIAWCMPSSTDLQGTYKQQVRVRILR